MDERIDARRKKVRQAVKRALERFQMPLLVLALGVLLLLLPAGSTKEAADADEMLQADTAMALDEQALQELLSHMEGVGRVELLLRTDGSAQTQYLTDLRTTEDTMEQTTVFQTGQSSRKTPVVVKTTPPEILGALIVCDGADSALVRLRLTQAVSALTGLGSDKISVMKMKGQQEDGT